MSPGRLTQSQLRPAPSGPSGASGPPLPQSPRGLLTGELCVQQQGCLHCPCPGIGAVRPQTASLPGGFAAQWGPWRSPFQNKTPTLPFLAPPGLWGCGHLGLFPPCCPIPGGEPRLGDSRWGSRRSPKAQESSGGQCCLEAAVSGRVLTTPPPRSSHGAWTLASESASWTARGPGSCRASLME